MKISVKAIKLKFFPDFFKKYEEKMENSFGG